MMPAPDASDLQARLDHCAGIGVTDVVSLLAEAEAQALGLQDEAAACAAQGLGFTQYPIEDFGLPEPAAFARFIAALTARLEAGAALAIHCRAGIGRSGMLACGLLMARGIAAPEAILQVTHARGVSIPDTVEQATFINGLGSHLCRER